VAGLDSEKKLFILFVKKKGGNVHSQLMREETMNLLKKIRTALVLAILTSVLSGCVMTKVVTVPMRMGGAVVSVVPVAGNLVDKGVDAAADAVDTIPL
jgi:hypothetical protein